jgi:hypothetical protein
MRPLLTHCTRVLIYLLSLQQILTPLMSSCGYTRTLCAGRAARTPRRAARTFGRSDPAPGHADQRLTCGSHVVGGALTHLKLLLAARGPPKTGFEPRRGRGIVFRNSRISLSAGRRACKPAAKPAIRYTRRNFSPLHVCVSLVWADSPGTRHHYIMCHVYVYCIKYKN